MLLTCDVDRTTQGNERLNICKMDPFLRKQHGSFHPLIISSTTWDLDNLPDAVLEPGGKRRRCPRCEETKCLVSINQCLINKSRYLRSIYCFVILPS